ncbi:hypothetical protein SAMD00019534_014490 [Acytostelium subglobosum LB1]|uniref:hypothetical protein n=1 Tax=Acytostelium subglobosum LB1 TaxID=1410327 RepID=UPI000644AAD0|nr:hypothetical protein SAMD00019534_014490 [Acytostelium subglobosum LB1]GAM18274.1 hypothetical protein SAMD00019534_014490 [Acytostelium subglobosum LB1]|eukprot:XP_012758870.1 hypothetical protein SAMD00019534_014490 [Acytostelium subglobosum LB1]
MWEQLAFLVNLMITDRPAGQPNVKEFQWRFMAEKLGTLTLIHCGNKLSSYMHMFKMHVGYFLERYGNLERYSLFCGEFKHKNNRATKKARSNSYRYATSKVDNQSSEIDGHLTGDINHQLMCAEAQHQFFNNQPSLTYMLSTGISHLRQELKRKREEIPQLSPPDMESLFGVSSLNDIPEPPASTQLYPLNTDVTVLITMSTMK